MRAWFRHTAGLLLRKIDPDAIVIRILGGPGRGLKFRMATSPTPELAFALGRYERDVATRLAAHCRRGAVVWECGAHVGYFTTLIASFVGPTGTVVVFEPDPANRAATEANLRLNRFTHVRVLPLAIGEHDAVVTFHAGRGATSRLDHSYVGGTGEAPANEVDPHAIAVRCVSLDRMAADGTLPPPQVLKIDIEGAELFALPHAEQLLSKHRPVVFIESHNPQTDALIWDTFARLGYQLEHVPTGARILKASDVRQQILATPA
jgi:FkbM family methyltransferase